MEPDQRVIKSYVWHKDKCFFISTINRDSSALAAYGRRYAETLAWEYDFEKSERIEIVGQDEGVEGSITKHMLMCQRLHDTGIAEEVDA